MSTVPQSFILSNRSAALTSKWCPTGNMDKTTPLWSIWLYSTELIHGTHPQGLGMRITFFYSQT